MGENVGLFQYHFHAFRVGDKVGRGVATVKLHAFNHLQGGLHGLGLLHRNDALFANLVHGLGNDVANGFVVVGADGPNLSDFCLVLGGLAQLLELLNRCNNGLFNTTFESHGIVTRCHQLGAFMID